MGFNPVAHFPIRSWLRVFGRVAKSVPERNLGLVSAGVAFFAFLSIFPALAAALTFWAMFAEPALLQSGVGTLSEVVPDDAASLVTLRLEEMAKASQDDIGLAAIFSLLFALFWARMGIAALMGGLNAVYLERPPRNPLRVMVRAIVFTIVLIVMGLAAVAAALIVPAALEFLPMTDEDASMVWLLQWGLSTTILFLGLSAIYRYGPNRTQARLGWVFPGAFLAILLWLGASIAMSFYISKVAYLNELYGSVGAVMALMLWLFVGALSVLLGASLNAELELETERDTTIPPEKPMGLRGAFVADTTADAIEEHRDAYPRPSLTHVRKR